MIQFVKKIIVSFSVLGLMVIPLMVRGQSGCTNPDPFTTICDPVPPTNSGGSGSPGNSGGSGSPTNGTSGSSGSGGPNGTVAITIENPLSDKKADSIPAVLQIVFNDLVLPIGAMVAVIYIMYAGFMMVTAQGNAKQIDEAKKAFFNAAIGTAILLGAWAISQAIATTINNIVAP